MLTHSLFDNHFLAELSDVLQVGRSARGDGFGAKDELLGNTTAHGASEDVFEIVNTLVTTVFWRQEPGDTTSATTRDNGNLVYGVRVWQNVANNSMSGFMISGEFALLLVHHFTFTLRANRDTFEGFGDIVISDFFVTFASCSDCRLVGDIGKVSTGATSGLSS